MSNLVSTQWLADHLHTDDLIILDASWHLPSATRDARAEFTAAHIPGARFFDLDKVSDQNSTLPHMLPTAEAFAASMAALGINSTSHVVAYDTAGLFSAARCWWMFKAFGHDKVSVLDGGLKKWLVEGRAVQGGEAPRSRAGNFVAKFNPAMVRKMAEVAEGTEQVADARSPTRFRGEEPEPRPGVKPGHMPGAKNIYYATLLNADGTLKPYAELAQHFTNAEINLEKPIVTSCGSGVTAAILSLALTELGVRDHALYDGSWAEWGASTNRKVIGP
jgi:thiosulfate/3-mercaptopyruvate sulfurtransferase